MESISWSFVVTALVGGTDGQFSQKLSEETLKSAEQFFALLTAHAPDLAKQLESADDPSMVDEALVMQVKQVAVDHPDMQTAATAISREMIQQFGGTD